MKCSPLAGDVLALVVFDMMVSRKCTEFCEVTVEGATSLNPSGQRTWDAADHKAHPFHLHGHPPFVIVLTGASRSQLSSESLKEHSCAHDLLLVMEALLSTRSSHWTVLCLEKLLQKVLSFSSGPSSWQTDADTDHVVSKSARSQWRGHNWAECSFQSSQHPHTHTLIANILLPKFPRPPWRFVLWALDACDKKSKSVTESNNFSCGF